MHEEAEYGVKQREYGLFLEFTQRALVLHELFRNLDGYTHTHSKVGNANTSGHVMGGITYYIINEKKQFSQNVKIWDLIPAV